MPSFNLFYLSRLNKLVLIRINLGISLLIALNLGTSACSYFNPKVSEQPNASSTATPTPNTSVSQLAHDTPEQISHASTPDNRQAERYAYEQSDFSFIPPDNWKPKDVTGIEYKAFVAESSDNLAPSINVIDEAFAGSLNEYVDLNLRSVEKAFKNFKKVKQSEFKTDTGESGIEVITESEQLGNQLRQTLYIFNSPENKKIVITCSSLAKDGDRLAPIFASSIKTFKFKKAKS